MANMRRFYFCMQNFVGLLVLWLCVLLALSLVEMNSLAWKMGGKSSVFQSYSFVVLQLPLHALVLFGSYALCNIGYNLMTLEDCDAAHLEVVAQIKEAKEGLRKRGYKLPLAECQ